MRNRVIAALLLCTACLSATGTRAYEPGSTDTRPVKETPKVPEGTPAAGTPAAEAEPEKPFLTVELDLSEIDKLAVQSGGRKMPFQTYAYEAIEQMVGRPFMAATPYYLDKDTNTKIKSTDLFISIWLYNSYWAKQKVILAGDASIRREVVADLSKDPEVIKARDDFRASRKEIQVIEKRVRDLSLESVNPNKDDEAAERKAKASAEELAKVEKDLSAKMKEYNEKESKFASLTKDEVQAAKHFSPMELQKSAGLEEIYNSAKNKRHLKLDDDMTSVEKEAELVVSRINIFYKIRFTDQELAIVPHPSEEGGTWISMVQLLLSHKAWSVLLPNGQKLSLAEEEKGLYSVENEPNAGAKEDEDGKTLSIFLPNRPAFKVSKADMEKSVAYYTPEQTEQARKFIAGFITAYKDKNRTKESVSKAAADLRGYLKDLSPKVYPSDAELNREIAYNQTRPFAWAWRLYFVAAILAAFSLKLPAKGLYYATGAVFLGGLSFHIYGFVLRCLIAGRPPVSNMYESVIWVGFGAVVFGLVFELIHRKRYFMLCGAISGFLCLVMMDLLPVVLGNAQAAGMEANIKPLLPVLRNNFWLTVHVLTITLSYAAFLLAWALGHVTLGSHLFFPSRKAQHHELHHFIYRVVQVGVLLLAIGTILGGVWAYYSWGRFWGWDPKETWAFIALMCYLVVLHGRFTGWWGNFGLSVGSVVCFQAVVMAWYGVNFVLGNGLHAYGNGAGGVEFAVAGVSADLIFTGCAIYFHLNRAPGGGSNSGGSSGGGDSAPSEVLVENDPIQQAIDRKDSSPAVPAS